MQLLTLLEDAERQLNICNACRYCEGYCAVFPALERRVELKPTDVLYIANLCHDCRACYYACPFVHPHEFELDLPRALSAVRRASYARYSPRRLGALLTRLGRKDVAVVTAVALIVLLGLVAATSGVGSLTGLHIGPGAFYEVVPWLVMVVPGMILGLYVFAALLLGGIRFLREVGTTPRQLIDIPALATAGWEALTLRWLKGGDEGCHYPTYGVSRSRVMLHALVAGGFVAAFVSTGLAAVYQDVFGIEPPYDLLSAPVAIGTLGGFGMIVGCAGLLLLKRRSDRRPTDEELVEFDVTFLITLGISSLTGILLLPLRDSPLLGAMLVVHLAVLTTLYVTAPYGKFAHFVYRYAALLRNRIEIERDESQTA